MTRRLEPNRWIPGAASVAALLLATTGGVMPSPAVAQAGSPVVTQHQLQMVEMRLERVERLLDSGVLTDMLQRVDLLQAELRQLRGQVDQLDNELRNLRARQRDQFRGLDERLTAVEGGMAASTPPASPDPVPAPSVAETFPDPDEQGAYQAAFELLMSGDYPEAMLRLERFLERYPDGVYSANALYWLAESKYATREYQGALLDFQAVRERFPDSDKAGDALLKIGYSHFELGNVEAAREALTQVVADHSGTTLSRLAQDRLRRMDGR